MESCKDMTQHRKRLNKESFMIEKGEEPRSSAVKMKIRAKKIDRQREKWRNIKGNQGFAAGCGSTSKIEICEKCCPRLDIGRHRLAAREVAVRVWLKIYPSGRKKCREICGRGHCSEQGCAEIFHGYLRERDAFYPERRE